MLVPPEGSSAVLVMICNTSLCLSATVLVLDYLTVAEITSFEGLPKFDALIQRTPGT